MSAPLKPWERAGINTRSSTLSFDGTTRLPLGAGGPRLNALRNSGDMDTHSSQSTSRTKAPPLPPRPQTQRSNGGLMYGGSRYGYGGNMYGGYNSIYGGGFGGHGMYGGGYGGGYGGYGLGMNRFGSPFNQSGSSSFVGRAEESSRAAFQSIESIVQAFGSVAMMLESTHFAMHNTFTAVLSMADHFSRLRAHLVSVLGAFTLFRAIRYIFRKIRALLGLATNQGLEEELWDNAATDVSSSGCEGGNSKKPISWPILLFFGVVLGTPLIIWKLLQSLMNDESSTKDWKTGEGDHVIARAEYDFDGEGEEELSFRAGNILRLAPKGKQPRIRGWLLGTVDGSTEGIVPANYVKILGLRRRKKQVRESKQDSSQEQCGLSEANLGHEFVKEEDKADGNGLISSQDLITEETLNEETLADSELLDSDLRSLNEGQN